MASPKKYPHQVFTSGTDGGLEMEMNCTRCGKPISRTSADFGMDCEDRCGELAFKSSGGGIVVADAMRMLSSIFGDGNKLP